MKRMKDILHLGSAVAAVLVMGACSQEATDGETGGKMPVELTATGLQPEVSPMTRATVDGNWDNVGEMAVMIDGVAKIYKVEALTDPNEATLTCAIGDPFYWTSGSATVSAWWPYDNTPDNLAVKPVVTVIADQSDDGYKKSDFIEAIDKEVTPTSNKLVFTHRTARIRVLLTKADGTTALTGATVALDMDDVSVVTECHADATATDNNGHVALIAPKEQSVLKVKISAGGKDYVYTHEAYTFDANKQYTFKLKVKDGEAVKLEGCTISGWTDNPMDNGTAEVDKGFTKSEDGKTYFVTSAKGLKAWAEAAADDPTLNCKLMNNITMPAVADGESNWTPVGGTKSYRGTFDGNGKTITGLRVIAGTTEKVGLFSYNSGTVRDLTLNDAKVEGKTNVGAVVGNNYGTISHCYVTNSSVSGKSDVGGIVGNYSSSTIEFCGVSGVTVEGTDSYSYIGGIVGEFTNGKVVGCYAVCELKGSHYIGGITGAGMYPDLFTACYADCTFPSNGATNVGGIAGIAGYTTFTGCYWTGQNVERGVCDNYEPEDPNGVIQASDGWTEAVMNAMNGALPAESEYIFGKSEAGSSVPFVHVPRNKQQ